MKIEKEKHGIEVHVANLSGSKFDDVDLSRSDFRRIRRPQYVWLARSKRESVRAKGREGESRQRITR
jgi:hypothetical protein